MDITHITSLLGGIALFLYGMSIMGAGLEKLAGGKMQGVLQKLTSSTLKAVIFGTLTALFCGVNPMKLFGKLGQTATVAAVSASSKATPDICTSGFRAHPLQSAKKPASSAMATRLCFVFQSFFQFFFFLFFFCIPSFSQKLPVPHMQPLL